MPKYHIKERLGCWVTFTKEVEAANETEAFSKHMNGEAVSVGEAEIGDSIDDYAETDIVEVQ